MDQENQWSESHDLEVVSPRPKFSDAIASPIYVVKVGPEGKTFNVHSDLLKGQSSMLELAFNSGFVEGQTKTVELKDEDPDLFGFFLKYLYNPDWAASLRPSGVIECVGFARLYALADRLLASQFKRQAMHWYTLASASLMVRPEPEEKEAEEEDGCVSSMSEDDLTSDSDGSDSVACCTKCGEEAKDCVCLSDDAFRLSGEDIVHLVKLLALIAEEIRLDDAVAYHALWLAGRNLSPLAKEPSFKTMLDAYPEIAKALCLHAADSEKSSPQLDKHTLPVRFGPESASTRKPISR